MTTHFRKAPGVEADFTLDWGTRFLAAGEQIFADLGWTATPDLPGGLVILTARHTDQSTTARLAGGLAGDRYVLTNAVRTTLGSEIRRALTIHIAHT